jgi:protein TonB
MFIRFASATAFGIVMTMGLLYVMQGLIHLQDVDIADPRERGILSFAPKHVPEELHIEEHYIPPLQKLTHSEPQPKIITDRYSGPGISVTRTPPTKPNTSGFGTTTFNHDGPLIAVVRVQPAYPVRASAQGIEGFVTVQFDVNADGTVSNISVVESSHRLFEPAAIRAAERFRFKARVVDGVPLATSGMRNRFVFELEKS